MEGPPLGKGTKITKNVWVTHPIAFVHLRNAAVYIFHTVFAMAEALSVCVCVYCCLDDKNFEGERERERDELVSVKQNLERLNESTQMPAMLKTNQGQSEVKM